MKKLLLLPLLLTFSTLLHAGEINVIATNFNQYEKGMVCVPYSHDAFAAVINASDFSTDNTNIQSTLKIAKFFDADGAGNCWHLPASGAGVITVGPGSQYVIVILFGDNFNKSYWHITDLEGDIDQVVTVP